LSAIEKQQIDIIKLLVDKGAQLSVKDSSGDTPMELACKNDFVKGEKIMIELNSKYFSCFVVMPHATEYEAISVY